MMIRALVGFLVGAALLFTGSVAAHASLGFGSMYTAPHSAAPEGFTLVLQMMDPLRTPIEVAVVAAEFRYFPEDATEEEAGEWHVFPFAETGPGGNYETAVTLPVSGRYQLFMRDTTYPQEDATAELFTVIDGVEEHGELLFIFPPTDIGAASVSTWLIWIVVIPVGAGIIVTVWALAPGRKKAEVRA